MAKVIRSVTSREFNQESSRLLGIVREAQDIVPVTYGRSGEVVAYVVPASVIHDEELIKIVTKHEKSASAGIREKFSPISMSGRPAASLDEMRDEESR